MPDERSDFAVRAGEGNGFVDAASKVGDAVLEVMVGNLHYVWWGRHLGDYTSKCDER